MKPLNKLHDWLIAARTIARISENAGALGEEIAWLRREAHVRGECLEIAMAVLERLEVSTTWKHVAAGALAKIEQRLAQLEPEEETG